MRELEERQRAEQEWRAHQAQPTPHQQLVQDVENLPTNQRSSFLLQRAGQSHSENSSVVGHGFLNGSSSHLDHGTSTPVSAWTGRGLETAMATNAASAVTVDKNMSQLSVAVNIGAGARRGGVDSSYPGHDGEEDNEPVKPGSSGMYDIWSWLPDKSSGATTSVEQISGVAQFVTQAKPQVDRRPTGESAGIGMGSRSRSGSGMGMGAGTSSAVATPTTAVQSHVRFPPGACSVTDYYNLS